MRPDEFPDEFEIDLAAIWPEEDGQLEPVFLAGPLWIDFEEFEPLDESMWPESAQGASAEPILIGFDEPEQPGSGLAADALDRAPPQRQRASAASLAASLGVHLLTLVVLIAWTSTPLDMPGAMPVQLVLETRAPAVDPNPPGEALGESTADPTKESAAAPPTRPPPPIPPPPTKVAAATEPPKPAPPKPTPIRAPPPAPSPAPKVTHVAAAAPAVNPAPSVPAPARAVPVVATAASAPSPAPIPVARPTPAVTTATGRGDYLNHLVVLTRHHLDILPLSFLNGRRGRATLSVLVFEDGSIGRISVKRSSGYPDIDAKIEQMVAAVGRFPALPASLPHPAVDLDFDMSFPDALQQ